MAFFKRILILLLVVSQAALAGQKQIPSVDEAVARSLRYISHQQFQQNSDIYLAGEWPVEMKSYLLPALLGVGKLFAQPTDEPTSFASSSIINLLAETYLIQPNQSEIPQMINLGIQSLPVYKTGQIYSYYRWQDYKGTQVRGPLAKGYVPEYIRGLTNIPADADTTSATYMALAYSNLINQQTHLSEFSIPTEALDTFNTHRDLDRKSHYFNSLEKIRNSGAFLTWFQNDKDASMPRGIFKKPDQGTRIPFGKNDVDCVVNANVMRLLTATNNKNHPGYADSCRLLNTVIMKENQKSCGIYYPNSYATFYSISNVYKAGAECLVPSRHKALDFIITTQKEDGSWDNEPGIGRTDTIQSTALALNALMNYTAKGEIKYSQIIRRGAQYLLKQHRTNSDSEIYWKGEVFFSAVAQARNTVLWRSNTYTTALVTLALVKAQDYLDGDL